MAFRVRFRVVAGIAAAAIASQASAALVVTQNTSIAAARAAFGPVTTAITWSNLFPVATTWSAGAYAPAYSGGTATDPVTGSGVSGNLSIANYIDGVGFDHGTAPTADLALNGPEDFTLTFAAPVSRIGFAAATGAGSFPSEYDHLGTVFALTTSTGETGTMTMVDSGQGLRAWFEIEAATSFTSISFYDTSRRLQDQYFGDVLAGSALSPAPEPASWAMMLAGFLGIGSMLRRRPRVSRAIR